MEQFQSMHFEQHKQSQKISVCIMVFFLNKIVTLDVNSSCQLIHCYLMKRQ